MFPPFSTDAIDIHSESSHRFGRRRPFILALSVVLLAALFLIPFGNVLTLFMVGPDSAMYNTITVTLLIIGAIMLDFSCQVSSIDIVQLLSDNISEKNENIWILVKLTRNFFKTCLPLVGKWP